jgi:hypothetical protein
MLGRLSSRALSPAFLVWLVISILLTYFSWDQIAHRGGWDPDDQLRMVQLRDFLGGQGWFDNSQHRLNGLDGAPMHWSRLIELPLAFVVLIATPFFGQPTAEIIAGTAVPLGCYGAVVFMLAQIARSIGGRLAAPVAVVIAMVSPAIAMQLRPMRIDHHGWQLVCAALSFWSLFWPSPRKAGIAMGLALAIWLHISLEGAPAAAAFFGLLGWRWITDHAERERLGWTVGSFAAASLALFLGTQSAGFAAPTYCDTLSPAHIVAIGLAAVVILPASLWLSDKRLLRIAVVILAGLAAGGSLLAIAPVCGTDAFSNLDPVVREYWYLRVTEGLPVWRQEVMVAVTLLGGPVAALLAYLALRRTSDAGTQQQLNINAALVVATVVLALLVFRAISVAAMVSVPLVAAWIASLFAQYRTEPAPVRRIGKIALIILLLMPGAFGSKAITLLSPAAAAQASEDRALAADYDDSCGSLASIAKLSALKNVNIAAPFDIGPAILLTTPHHVLASSHHRNGQGMRDLIDIYRLPPAQSRAIALRRKITHIIICPDEAEMKGYANRNPDGLSAQLVKGNTPDWLVPLQPLNKSLKVWQVRQP